MQRHDVGARKQIVEPLRRARIAEREFGLDIVIDHLHAEAFGEYADLRADMAVADDAEHLAAYLDAACGRLRPAAAMALRTLLRDAAREHDRFGDHELGHAARVRIWRVEHRNAERLGRLGIDLIGADAEAADCN